MIEFFENLKQKRIDKGITLKDIAAKTLLSIDILSAIENGEMDKLPYGYHRIYLRRYVKEIDLNVDEVMKDYSLLIGDTEEQPKVSVNAQSSQKEWKFDPGKLISREKLVKNVRMAAIFTVVILVIILVYYATDYFKKNRSYDVKEMTVENMVGLTDSVAASASAKDSVIEVKLESPLKRERKFKFEITATGNCWIRQIKDFKDTTEYILRKGQIKPIAAYEQVKFVVGNGGAFIVRHSGKTYKNIAPAGSIIRRLIIDKNGIADKYYTMPKKEEKSKDSTVDSTATVNKDSLMNAN